MLYVCHSLSKFRTNQYQIKFQCKVTSQNVRAGDVVRSNIVSSFILSNWLARTNRTMGNVLLRPVGFIIQKNKTFVDYMLNAKILNAQIFIPKINNVEMKSSLEIARDKAVIFTMKIVKIFVASENFAIA